MGMIGSIINYILPLKVKLLGVTDTSSITPWRTQLSKLRAQPLMVVKVLWFLKEPRDRLTKISNLTLTDQEQYIVTALSKPPLVDVEHLQPITRSWVREASTLGLLGEHIVVARYELGQGYSVLVRNHRLSPSSITNLGKEKTIFPKHPKFLPKVNCFF